MLGFERKEPFVVKGIFAKRLREQLYRIHTGQLNRKDCLALKFELSKPKNNIVWDCPEPSNMIPTLRDSIIMKFAESLSEYVVIVDRWVKFDFSKITKQMKFLKGYGLAKVKFKDMDFITREVIIDSMDKSEGRLKDDIIEILKTTFNPTFKNDIKNKQYVYVKFGSIKLSVETENAIVIQLKIFRPYSEETMNG